MDDALVLLKRILTCFDLDFFQGPGQIGLGRGPVYTVRLWDEGEQIASVSDHDLLTALREIDKSAAAIANYG